MTMEKVKKCIAGSKTNERLVKQSRALKNDPVSHFSEGPDCREGFRGKMQAIFEEVGSETGNKKQKN